MPTSPSDSSRSAGPPSRRDFLHRALLAGAAGLAASTLAAGPARANTQRAVEPAAGRARAKDGRFAGKVVLVTGATSGIGEATAKAFAHEGARVFFCGRREELGRKVEAEIRDAGGEALYLRADVRDPKQVEAFVAAGVERYGRLDIAFNNAGTIAPPHAIAEYPLEDWNNVMTTNATGTLLCMKHEIALMLRQGGGVIVNNASVSAHVGFATIAAYNASKHAIYSLTKVAALEYSAKNIRVNCVSPGAVDTPMLRGALKAWNLTLEAVAKDYPLNRIVQPEEIARAVMFLASDEASCIAGTDLDVTGGYLTK